MTRTRLKLTAMWKTYPNREFVVEWFEARHFFNGRAAVYVKLDSGYTFCCDKIKVAPEGMEEDDLTPPGAIVGEN